MPQMSGTPDGAALSESVMRNVLVAVLCSAVLACAARNQAPPANPAAPTVHYDMEPIAIEVKRTASGEVGV